MLQVLTSNPEVWSKTVLLLNYDENDGFFDHMAPPFAPASDANGLSTVPITNEIYEGNGQYAAGANAVGPYGLGPRVPMIVISPWSKGGYVCSELFDHTSVIRFIEKRFGHDHDLGESNITPWRRAICGDWTLMGHSGGFWIWPESDHTDEQAAEGVEIEDVRQPNEMVLL